MYNNPYYNPYINNMNYINPSMLGMRPKPNIFKGISNIKWGDVLNNTQKTLNVINQAIPVYYQVKPIFSNIKSFGRLMSAFNEEDNTQIKNISKTDEILTETKKENKNSPTFFID